MSKLDKQFLDKQKDLLLKEKEKVEKSVAKLKEYPNYGDDEEDGLQEMTDYESNLSIDEQMELLLKKIDKALKAIETGTYGQCSKCREAIEEGRLEAIPYADLCVTCQSKK